MQEPAYLAHSPAAKQWQEISIRPHHGIAIPLFSLHSSHSCGIGEYSDLRLLIDWCISIGFDVIQLLPLNDCGLGTSPYSSLSAFALDPIYLGLSALPHSVEHPTLVEKLKSIPKFSHAARVDYVRVREHKENYLRDYFELVGPRILNSAPYVHFVEQAAWLKGYAAFKILKQRHEWSKWETWPEDEQAPSSEFIDHILSHEVEECNYHCFLQFLCDQQLSAIKTYARAKHLLLMGDIPILIDRESADVWQYPELFDLHYSAGSPPDIYSENGQNWGFPIYRWKKMEEQNYGWWSDRLRWANRYYHIYRLDHIVGFFRIWAIPLEHPGKEGHFIPLDETKWIDQGQRLLLMMLNACDMLPIGEDLGIVPPEVRTCLSALGICGTRVMRWQRRWEEDGRFIPAQDYQFDSLTTVSTHDSETVQHWWKNYPIEAQLFANFKGWSYQPLLSHDHQREILWDSHHTASLFHINLLQEYLALIPGLSWPTPEEERINIPGLVSDRNWTYRLRLPIEELAQQKSLNHLMRELIT